MPITHRLLDSKLRLPVPCLLLATGLYGRRLLSLRTGKRMSERPGLLRNACLSLDARRGLFPTSALPAQLATATNHSSGTVAASASL